MKAMLQFLMLITIVVACQSKPLPWNGPVLTEARDHLTVEELTNGTIQPLVDMSYYAMPKWADQARTAFSGRLTIESKELIYPKQKSHYEQENYFPELTIDLISFNGALIPSTKRRISTKEQPHGFWDIMLGAGKVWHEEGDGDWNRASLPINLMDRWVGTVRNCVASFVYTEDSVSQVCLQCSQETADIDDQGISNIHGTLLAHYAPRSIEDSARIVENHLNQELKRIPTIPLSEIDANGAVAKYFDDTKATNAPTSLGAVLWNEKLYLHPPKTRHGDYPYPDEMRHGLYSVTKTLAGALVLLYFEERYDQRLFDAHITDYVPVLKDLLGWKDVTFGQTLNMVTGTEGGEDAWRLLEPLVLAETAEEAIQNIAQLGDLPPQPGETFRYATTNLFVLSYALQRYVEEQEGETVNYWELVRENVLNQIGAEYFDVVRTIEVEPEYAIPILGYGALPTIDEAAKIALLFKNEGEWEGKQILNKKRTQELLGKTSWPGYSTNGDYRGSNYQHAMWSKEIKTPNGMEKAFFMLGFGEHYIVFLPSGAILFRFMDEHDLDIDKLMKLVEKAIAAHASEN